MAPLIGIAIAMILQWTPLFLQTFRITLEMSTATPGSSVIDCH